MKLVIMTLVLDGMPFIRWQHECFKKLTCDWTWYVIEGAAGNKGSTKWCKPQPNRLSNDGTTEFLRWEALLSPGADGRINYFHNVGGDDQQWESKDYMTRICTDNITEPCVLMQIDVDETHKPQAIDKVVWLFENDETLGLIRFPCRYFVGPRLVCEGENCWSNKVNEYDRAWRFEPGMFFISHEPPLLNTKSKAIGMMTRENSQKLGLTFDHLAYVTESQVKYKEEFYGYSGLLNQWRALQRNTFWPAKLSRFFPFVNGELPSVVKL